jgi:hypothetical protein
MNKKNHYNDTWKCWTLQQSVRNVWHCLTNVDLVLTSLTFFRSVITSWRSVQWLKPFNVFQMLYNDNFCQFLKALCRRRKLIFITYCFRNLSLLNHMLYVLSISLQIRLQGFFSQHLAFRLILSHLRIYKNYFKKKNIKFKYILQNNKSKEII